MTSLSFSARAKTDLISIYKYSRRTWGAAQGERYAEEFETCFQQLVANPRLGRAADYFRVGVRRIEQGSHVIFYRLVKNGIVIVRIKHKRMLP